MPLLQDIRTLRAPAVIDGQSDAELVKQVDKHVKRELAKSQPPLVLSKKLVPAAGLDSGTCVVRPIDALLRLSRATALTLPPSTASMSRWWPVLRYLGAFEAPEAGRIRINPASTVALRHNERRIFSEELGVGFGILLGERWCHGLGATGAVSVLDAGAALRDPSRRLGTIGRLVPDYVLRYTDRSQPSISFFAALECKGTQDPKRTPIQLGHAMRQVDALRLDGTSLPGVGIATVTNSTQIAYKAVDPPGNPVSFEFVDDDLAAAHETPVSVSVENGRVDVSKREFLRRAVTLDDASLAAFSGDFAAARRWAPAPSGPPLSTSDLRLDRIEDDAWTGTTARFATPTGELEIFAGVASAVLEALRSSSDRDVRAAQSEVLDRHTSSPDEGDVDEARAVGSDGSMLLIRRRPRTA